MTLQLMGRKRGMVQRLDADGNIVCTKSIRYECTEATQPAVEAQMTASMQFIAEAPQRIAELDAENKLLRKRIAELEQKK